DDDRPTCRAAEPAPAAPAGVRPVRRGDRLQHRLRGPARHRRRPGLHPSHAAVGDLGVRPGLRWPAAPRRPRRRRARQHHDLPRGPVALRCRLAARRAGPDLRRPHRRPRPAGRRWRTPDPGNPGADQRRVRRGPGAQSGPGPVGRRRSHRAGRRLPAGRRPDRSLRLAVGLPGQRATRGHRSGRRRRGPAGQAAPRRFPRPRPARRPVHHRRRDRIRVHAGAGPGAGVDLVPRPGRPPRHRRPRRPLRRRGARCRRSHPPGGTAPPPPPRHRDGHHVPLHGVLRDRVLPVHRLLPGRARVLRPAGGAGVHAGRGGRSRRDRVHRAAARAPGDRAHPDDRAAPGRRRHARHRVRHGHAEPLRRSSSRDRRIEPGTGHRLDRDVRGGGQRGRARPAGHRLGPGLHHPADRCRSRPRGPGGDRERPGDRFAGRRRSGRDRSGLGRRGSGRPRTARCGAGCLLRPHRAPTGGRPRRRRL
ncbi:MAG: Uncharacterized MFS-type transporter, partial [uncultured Blastococcus sp.]